MIVKEMDPMTPATPMEKAGMEAEKTMAFYLKRAFASEPQLHVSNGLRFAMAGDAAQIDHLIVHPYGLIIIESKSVTTTIGINEFGEWSRIFQGKKVGIPSPILQARCQGEFLLKLLNTHAGQLMDTLYDQQHKPRSIKLDLLVAISDGGLIERAPGQNPPELSKADQIPDRVKAIVQRRRAAAEQHAQSLSPDELRKISHFLVSLHSPLHDRPLTIELSDLPGDPASSSNQYASIMISTEPVCRHCHNAYLAVVHGRYGYYFKCLHCNKNTNIKLYCPTCSAPGKLYKREREFYAVCQACGANWLYFTNPYQASLARQQRQNAAPGCIIGLLGLFWRQ